MLAMLVLALLENTLVVAVATIPEGKRQLKQAKQVTTVTKAVPPGCKIALELRGQEVQPEQGKHFLKTYRARY